MRYYASVPDWAEFQEREASGTESDHEGPGDDQETPAGDPSFLKEESSTDTDLLTDGGSDGD